MKIHGLGLIQRPELLRSQEKGTGTDRARTEIGAETVELSDTARFIREIRDQLAQRPRPELTWWNKPSRISLMEHWT